VLTAVAGDQQVGDFLDHFQLADVAAWTRMRGQWIFAMQPHCVAVDPQHGAPRCPIIMLAGKPRRRGCEILLIERTCQEGNAETVRKSRAGISA